MTEGKQRLAEIFTREKSRFLGFVRKQVMNLSEVDAEDILSEVTYNLLLRSDIVGEVENLSAYIYRSLSNSITDRHRKSATRSEISLEGGNATNAPVFEPPDKRPRPDQRLEQTELRERLFQAIGELNPHERAVWVATEIDGRSFRELADEWEEPIGTLLSRKSRANDKLRTLLADYRSIREE